MPYEKQRNGTMTQSEESIMLMTAYSLSTITRAHSVSIMTSWVKGRLWFPMPFPGARHTGLCQILPPPASPHGAGEGIRAPPLRWWQKYFINPLILVMSLHIGINTALHDFHNLVIESRVKINSFSLNAL